MIGGEQKATVWNEPWSLKTIVIFGAIGVVAVLAWGVLMYLSFKAWVWTIVQLAKYWGYLA